MKPGRITHVSVDTTYAELINGRYARTCREGTGMPYYPPARRSLWVYYLATLFVVIITIWVAAMFVAVLRFDPTPRATPATPMSNPFCLDRPEFRKAQRYQPCVRID